MTGVTAVGAIAGSILSVCAVLGLAVRFILLPYLRTHVIEPLHETRHQVTVNHHSSAEPTVLDRISDVNAEVAKTAERIEGLAEQVERLAERDTALQANMTAVTLVLDEHLRWSREWVQNHE